MNAVQHLTDLVGRALVSIIFLVSGVSKITGYTGIQAYMESAGVPGILLPLVIALEILGAVALSIGFQTRVVAAALAGFTLVAGVAFHANFGDQMQAIMFMKNLAIAGGLLFLVNRGAGSWSLDALAARG